MSLDEGQNKWVLESALQNLYQNMWEKYAPTWTMLKGSTLALGTWLLWPLNFFKTSLGCIIFTKSFRVWEIKSLFTSFPTCFWLNSLTSCVQHKLDPCNKNKLLLSSSQVYSLSLQRIQPLRVQWEYNTRV